MKHIADRVDLRFNIVLFGLFAAVAVAGYLGFQQIRQELLNEQLTINAAKTEALVKRVDQWLITRKTEVSTLANTPTIRSMDWAHAGPFLKAKHEQMPWFYIFAHINPDGTYYNSKVDFAKGQNLSDRAHFIAAMKGEVYASDPVNSRTLNNDIVAVTSPIFRSDRKGDDIIGVFGGMIDTTTIVDELKKFSNGPGSYAFAVNADGIAIAHPDPKRKGNINTRANSLLSDADPGLKQVTARMLEARSGWVRTTLDGQVVYANFEPLTQAKWYVATVTQAGHVEKTLAFINWMGAFALLMLCGVVALVVRFRRMELRTLSQQKEVAEEKSRAKSVFLASMSHELRTPLNGILGYSQILLQREGRDDATRRYLQIIQSSGQHLLSLINRVLDLSKIEAGRIELEPRPVDLNNLLQDLVRLFEIEKRKYGAPFSWRLAPDLDRVVVLDPDRFKQILTNVVVNAFKYGNGSEVVLDVKPTVIGAGKALALEVRDGGRGMTPEQVSRAFVPFEQTDKRSEGAGLGLAIVNELVRLMGGTIAIDSQPGQGTRVSITLPYGQADAQVLHTLPGGQGMPTGIRGARPRVLVVDDNPTNVEFLVDLLGMTGFDVVGRPEVDEALQTLDAQDVDLVITDLVMPERDGFDLIRAIRAGKRRPDVPIIVASASAFPGDQVRATAIGANEFLSKPVDASQLLQRMGALLKIEFVYGAEASDAVAPQPPQAALASSMLRTDAAVAVADHLREAAELGQVRRIEALVDGIADVEMRRAFRDLLGPALAQQDADLVLQALDGLTPLETSS
jgi:signal transduction histidine kinase/CheY-like chemotaxis protein